MAKNRNNRRKKGKKGVTSFNDGSAQRVFFNRFYKLLKIAGCPEAFGLLTSKEKTYIYELRIHLMQPKAAPSSDVPAHIIKYYKDFCQTIRQIEDQEFIPGEDLVSIVDLISLKAFLGHVRNEQNLGRKKELETAFAPLLVAAEQYGEPLEYLYSSYKQLLVFCNWCDQTMYGFETDFCCRRESVVGLYHSILIKPIEPRVSMIGIGGKKRPIFQIGWPGVRNGMDWMYLPTSLLGERYKGKLKEIPIYIQSHAINRFLERNAFVDLQIMNYSMMLCFFRKENFLIYNKHLLFTFTVHQVKTGYFLANLIGNKVVVRTFLFVTQHDTPEGNKLEEISGLTKEDIHYWKIDRLETFIENKLEENHKIRKLFKEVGISDLFELSALLEQEKYTDTYKWEALKDYIQKGQIQLADVMEEGQGI
ncbi:MAG: hypothetical protein ACEPOZ_10700 [Marinifilaceae bacterium]